MSNNLKLVYDSIPNIYKAEFNTVLNALIQAVVASDDEIQSQIANAKEQQFVASADGADLVRVANSLGVGRPAEYSLTDEQFRNLVPNLSLKPKVIRKAFYDLADVFWGPLYSRANKTSSNNSPFNISAGDQFKIAIDRGETQTITVRDDDIETPGSATTAEILAILERLHGATASEYVDGLTSDSYINIRTDSPGSSGSIEFIDSDGVTALGFELNLFTILDLDFKVCVYTIRPHEIIIELPAIIPNLSRNYETAHYLHEDSSSTDWEGNYLYNPSGSEGNYSLSSQIMELGEDIVAGNVYPAITVDDTSVLTTDSGWLVFDYGLDTQEMPVRFRAVPNTNTVFLDPSYSFSKSHSNGTTINALLQLRPYQPRKSLQDHAIYLTSPVNARLIAQNLLETIVAAGVVINFVIKTPTYEYLIVSPYDV